MRRIFLVTLLLVVLHLSGCNRGPEMVEVSGTVTLDGHPLDNAYIEFDAGDGTVPTSVDVAEGRFFGKVAVGEKTVRMFAMRPSKPDPRLGPTDMQAPFENVLSPRYGHDSKMKLDVTSETATDLTYDLESENLSLRN